MDEYSFCLFRIPDNGGRVLWEVTNTCNYFCKYCIFSAENKKNKGELSTSQMIRVLHELKQNNFTYIKFTGGEPFVRGDMIEILHEASRLGFDVDISTNASLITKEKAREINDANIKMVHASLDGHNREVHEFVRGSGTFDKTVNGIKNLVDNNIYVRIGTVIYKGNQDKIEDIIKYADSLGVNEIIFSFMEAVGRMKDDESLVSTISIEQIKSELERLKENYKENIKVSFSFTEDVKECESGICPGAKRFLYINNLGQVSPCSWVTEENKKYMSVKTLKESTLPEILDSGPISLFLQHVKELHQNGICGCPVKRR